MQGFGKRSKSIAMPRPKKKKVAAVEDGAENSLPTESNSAAATEASSSTDNKVEAEPARMPPESPGKQLRDAAAELEAQALLSMREADLNLKKAEAEWKLAQRLHEARQKRWDRADAQEPFVGSASAHLEKAWIISYKHALAELMYTEARRYALEHEAAVYATQMEVKDLEIARLRRLVRRYTRKRGVQRVHGDQ